MKPVIALVGRPNVGKSTIFNKLTRSKDALVADFPGLTRDRIYADIEFNSKEFILVDTGGIGNNQINVDELMTNQTMLAIKEAEIVFFIVDAREGLNPIDNEIAKILRKTGKEIYLVANKSEGLDQTVALAEFQRLGFKKVFGIAAAHNQGIVELMEDAIARLPEPEVQEEVNKDEIKVAFIGRPNVGKSTLVNALLGEERVVVYDSPGTTRDSIYIPFERNRKNYVLIDTAGMRRKSRVSEKIETFSVIKTLQSIEQSNVCVMVIDAIEGITDQDLHLLGYILNAGKSLVITVNKWDAVDEDDKKYFKNELERRLTFIPNVKILFISAQKKAGLKPIFPEINKSYDSANIEISTSKLTRMLEKFISHNPPPMKNRRRIKLRLAHLGGNNPPTIIVHGNQTESLPDSYKRYLINNYIQELKLTGTPLKIILKRSENPYKDKKNKLTPRQMKRKRRLIKHVKK